MKTSPKSKNEDDFDRQTLGRMNRTVSDFDMRAPDTGMGSFSFSERNQSVLMSDYFGRASVGPDSIPNRATVDRKRLDNMNVSFADSKTWKKESSCSVCAQNVDKMGDRHHCRICSGTVCSRCSEKRIKDKRVCDTCFFKIKFQDRSTARDETLTQKTSFIQQRKDDLFKEQRKLEQKRTEYKNLKNDILKTEEQEDKMTEQKRKEKAENEKALNTAKDLSRSLSNNIERNRQIISGKEAQLKNLQTKLSALHLEITQKMQIHEKLRDDYERAVVQREDLKNLNYNSSILSEAPDTGSVIGRSYAVYSNGKEGKYQLSAQPVEI